jgi:outer membrane protein assembly factor BamB
MIIMRRIVFIFVISVFYFKASAQDVAQWRGTNRDGIYNEIGLQKKWPDAGPKLLWHFDELGDGHTSAAVTSKAIFITGMVNGQGWVYSFDLTGKLLWKKEYGKEWAESHNGVRSTPLVVGDKLYLETGYGQIHCLKTADGSSVWTVDLEKQYGAKNIKWGYTENLMFNGNTLYCTPGGTGASVVALDRNTGKMIWKAKAIGETSAYCSPMIVNLKERKVLITFLQTSICGFDVSNGEVLWKFAHTVSPDVHPNTPVYKDGLLFCTTGYGKGSVMLKLAPDGKSVSEVWRHEMLDPKIGGVVLLNGTIYGGGDRNRFLFGLDWLTGKELFKIKDVNLAPSNIIANDGLIYIYAESGKVSLAEPKADGVNVISSFDVPYGTMTHWAHLVIKDKKLYVRHGNSLMVYDIGA